MCRKSEVTALSQHPNTKKTRQAPKQSDLACKRERERGGERERERERERETERHGERGGCVLQKPNACTSKKMCQHALKGGDWQKLENKAQNSIFGSMTWHLILAVVAMKFLSLTRRPPSLGFVTLREHAIKQPQPIQQLQLQRK